MTSTAKALSEFADTYGLTLMNQAQAQLPPRLRDLHQSILTAFVDTGAAPTTAWITSQATRIGADPNEALTRLAAADLVHTTDGAVTVAYPFSGTPTAHQVQLDHGPAVWAMCAADAIGIPLMTGRGATIASTDPHTGQAIRIRRHDGAWTWHPSGTVMLVAATTGCATAAETACRHVHFFAGPDNAQAYLRANPALDGEVYDQAASIEAGRLIFGPLLNPPANAHPGRTPDADL